MGTTKAKPEIAVTTIRLPAETKAWLENRAAENDRTMSAELRRIVEMARRADLAANGENANG